MANDILDIKGNVLNIGDECAFVCSNTMLKGYVYKITSTKLYVTSRGKDIIPFPDGHMIHSIAQWRVLKL